MSSICYIWDFVWCIKTWLPSSALSMGHMVQTFSYTTSFRCICSWSDSLAASSLLTAWGKIFRSQITNTKTPFDHTFLSPHNCNKANADSYTLSNFLWDVIMDLCKSVMKDDNILYALCTDTCSDANDDRKTKILDSVSDLPTILRVTKSPLFFY